MAMGLTQRATGAGKAAAPAGNEHEDQDAWEKVCARGSEPRKQSDARKASGAPGDRGKTFDS